MRMLSILACVSGFLAVAIGAFGAHTLKSWFAEHPGYHDWYQTGVLYHLLHAVIAVVAARSGARNACILFLVGTLLFSGSLYVMALTGVRGLGAVTPFGGLAFLSGWIGLAIRLAHRNAHMAGDGS